MPRLTAAFVRSVNKPGRHSDGAGLYLNVTPAGAKSWVFLWKRDGRPREMGLGSATGAGKTGVVTLSLAREKADGARRLLAAGGDPIAEKRREKVMTFGEAADALIASLEAGWKNAKHRAQWRSTMETYAAPLRRRSVRDIATEDVLSVLKPVWQAKPETASRVRGRIEKVLDYAKARGMREGENPARWKGNLDHLLSKPAKLTRGHHAAMPYAEAPAFLERLRGQAGTGARALEFTILTACRSGEVLGAEWAEIDLEARLWTIPAHRMKAGREHVVPLTAPAVAILSAMKRDGGGAFVFAGAKPEKALSNMAMQMVLRRMKVDVTPHGFRSSFRDLAGNETAFPREIAEEALAHAVGDQVERAYRRGAAIDRRRKLMDVWANYLVASSGEKVIPLRGIRAEA